MYFCECDYRSGTCHKKIHPLLYGALNRRRREIGDSGLYVVHEDHLAGSSEVQIDREGDCVLVRALIDISPSQDSRRECNCAFGYEPGHQCPNQL